MPTRILLADDHDVIRAGLRAILRESPRWQVCGEASTGRHAVDQCRELRPEVVIMDISMPDLNGLDATRELLKIQPETQVLVLSMHYSEQLVQEAFAAGARGYLLKSDAAAQLLPALEALSRQGCYFDPGISDLLLRGYLKIGAPRQSELTERERQVVRLVAEGNSNKEIAAAFQISIKTVETHRNNIMRKLNLRSAADLVRYAVRHGIVYE